MLTKLEEKHPNKSVLICHDHDNKTHSICLKHKKIDIKETLDPGHAGQELQRAANNYFEDCAREIRKDPTSISYQALEAQGEKITIKRCFEIFSTMIKKM